MAFWDEFLGGYDFYEKLFNMLKWKFICYIDIPWYIFYNACVQHMHFHDYMNAIIAVSRQKKKNQTHRQPIFQIPVYRK